MGNELALVAPIALPDLSKGRMPSLPAWVEQSRGALQTNLQMVHGTFREVLTLPGGLVPTPAQRRAIENHIRSLNSSFNETPEQGQEWAIKLAETASKLLLTLGGDKRNELAAEAKGEAYSDALDDIPWWAVEGAARSWYRGECGEQHNYAWPPDPATLREIALKKVWMVRARIHELQQLLDARPYVDCSEDVEKGAAAWRGLRMCRGEELERLSWDKAIEMGRRAANGN